MAEPDQTSNSYKWLRVALAAIIMGGLAGAMFKNLVTGAVIDTQYILLAGGLASALFGTAFLSKK